MAAALTTFTPSGPHRGRWTTRLGGPWRGCRGVLVGLMLVLLSTAALAAHPERALAACSGHAPEHGDWINADPAADGIARIELRDCEPVTTCAGGLCTTKHDVGWKLRPYGTCTPIACDWGWSTPQERLGTGRIYGSFDSGWARRDVHVKMSAYRPGQLWVFWRTDFADPNRADYHKQEWFRRA